MHIILNIIRILLTIVAAIVLVSYIVRRYEVGNCTAETLVKGEKASIGESLLGIVVEIGAVLISILLYPLGFIMREVPFAALHRGERPIIMCHGYMHNRSAFLLMGHRLRQAGRANLVAINFGPFSEEVPHFAQRLSETVDSVLVHSGCEKVDLIGHSMGGLIVRYYVEKLGGAASVNAAVTIGAPHRGTKMAALGIFRSSRQFSPNSDLIAGFEPPVEGSNVADMTAIWSDFDSVILPNEAARLPDPYPSVRVGGIGHVALLFSRRVFDEVRRILSDDRE